MAQRITRKQLLKQDEIAEAAFDLGHWIEENWQQVAKWAGALVLVVIAGLVAFGIVNARKEARLSLLAEAQRKFQIAQASGFANDEELSAALYGFDEVIDKAANSEVGQTAQYLKAVTLRKLGRTDEAIAAAEQVVGRADNPVTLKTTAELLLVDLYTVAGRPQDALARLADTIESTTPIVPKDQALLITARIHMEQGDEDKAREAWQRIVDEFPGTRAAGEATQKLGS